MTEKNTILGFVREPELEKANSAFEFGVSVPEMDEMAAEWDFILSNAESDLVGRDFHESSPVDRDCSAKQDVVDFIFSCLS
jgi:hypothetical protein